jgi:hypothetical protein
MLNWMFRNQEAGYLLSMEMKRKVQYTLEDVRNIAQEAIDRAAEKKRARAAQSSEATVTRGEIVGSTSKIVVS